MRLSTEPVLATANATSASEQVANRGLRGRGMLRTACVARER